MRNEITYKLIKFKDVVGVKYNSENRVNLCLNEGCETYEFKNGFLCADADISDKGISYIHKFITSQSLSDTKYVTEPKELFIVVEQGKSHKRVVGMPNGMMLKVNINGMYFQSDKIKNGLMLLDNIEYYNENSNRDTKQQAKEHLSKETRCERLNLYQR